MKEKHENTYEFMKDFLVARFSNKVVSKDDLPIISEIFNSSNIISLLESIINNDELLDKIEQRSYIHALGFDKIVLVDLSKDFSLDLPKSQIRLHIWDPVKENSMPIVESLHEHSFNFVSKVITGKIENQQYSFRPVMTKKENDLLEYLLDWRKKTDEKTISQADLFLEIIGAKVFETYGSEQFKIMYEKYNYNDILEKLCAILKLSKNDIIDFIIHFQGHYVSNRKSGEKKSYQHILKEYKVVKPYNLISIKQGESYFHPYQLPHRLYYDNTILNSTLLLTTPIEENQEGGSLQRPSYLQSNSKNYEKIAYKKGELKDKLNNLLNFLKQQH